MAPPLADPLPAVAVLLLALLAGCAGSEAPAAEDLEAAAPTTMSIVGLVQDEAFNRVADAQVSLRLVGQSTVTDADGTFRFDGLRPSAYLVDVNATGFEPASLTAEPRGGTNASLNFVLSQVADLRPSVVVSHFRGILQCAAESLIISPSCDTLVTYAGGPPLFNDTSTFDLGMARDWQGIVVDVDFEPVAGLDGLRLAVRGGTDADELNAYEQYGRFNASQPFTARLEPGGQYDDGNGPLPANTTLLQLQVYPHSHGWHATCAAMCALGVGFATDVRFDLYVSVFYNQSTPEGYTLMGS